MLVLMDIFGIKEAMSDFWRYVCMSIDNVVYWFVEVILQLIMDLSKVEIFTQTTINTITKRIYIILGLVMVFKMMISFIQILIDPDTLTDKEKGAGSVLKRVVISLVLIVLVPSIFSTARKIQTYVLPIIPRVIMGVTAEDDGDGITTESKIGKLMAWYSFLPFFDYAGTCNDGSIKSYDDTDNTSSSNVEISSVSEAFANINRKDKSCGEGDYHYVYNHKIIVSTIVGAYLVYTLVTVAVQVAVRAIKFGICEFIAPIPIASYIDPKTSKQTFDKWVSTSIKVYLDLFIQLIVVYFVAFIFQTYFADGNNFKIIVENTGGSFWRATLVILFMIVGLLSFVKQFPKFLSDLLGLNTNGDISKIFKGAGWKQVGGTLAAPAAIAKSGLSAFNYSRQKDESPLRSFGRGLSATFRGAKASLGAAADGKGMRDVFNTHQGVHGATMRRVNKAVGIHGEKEKYAADMKKYEAAQTKIANLTPRLDAAKQNASTSWSEYIAAKKRGDIQAANMHKNNYDNAKNSADRIERQIKDLNSVKKPVRPSSYGIGKISTMAKNFAGLPIPDSKSYTEAAKVMMSGKKIFNEAKDKVKEDPTVIRDSFVIKDKNGNSYGTHTFADVFAAHKEAEAKGSATFNGRTYDAATIEAIYGESLKTTATMYVNRVNKGIIPNGTMKQDIEIFNKSFDNEIVVDSADRVTNYDKNDPGSFLKGADEIARQYDSRAQDLRAIEDNK